MGLKFGHKGWLVILSILILTDLTILLNIPFLKQILGFIFLTILPGLLILQILKLNKIGTTEKFVLSVGLSVSFLIFFGLLINNLSLSLGYLTPLSTISLLISFNLAIIGLILVAHRMNKNTFFSIPNLNLDRSEKAFLVVPISFPALSIFGMHIMNMTDNNILLMLLLFSIPIYVAFVCFFNHKFPKRLYPVVIFLISISLLLMLSLRSSHLIGIDTHIEYYFFQTTLNNLHWRVSGHSTLDACLAISLLPTVYHSILNVDAEFLFKILYSLLYSISPLAIYVISKKYVEEGYAFLASCFFMFQVQFLWAAINARTNTAILFFGLAIMTFFNDKVDPLKKRILFIVFMASCMVSHYSTTYIFFFIMLGVFVGLKMLSRKYSFKNVISLTIVVLFFSLIFFWYSQVTETAFDAGVGYIENTLSSLNEFFIGESRRGSVQLLFGTGLEQKAIPQKIEFAFLWLTFAYIGIGIITLIRRYKEMSFSELKFDKPDFLKEKFEVTYFMVALACSGLLVATVALPYVSTGYGIDRLYAVTITILSVFFVIGGITLSKHFFFFLKRKRVLKEKNNCFFGRAFLSKEGVDRENALQVRAYLIILLVLIPYFLCTAGVICQVFGIPRSIILNSEGKSYDMMYVHDQESCGAKWLKDCGEDKLEVYADPLGVYRLTSQASLPAIRIAELHKISTYLYLRYTNVVYDKIAIGDEYYNMSECSIMFTGKNKIYANGGSEVYR